MENSIKAKLKEVIDNEVSEDLYMSVNELNDDDDLFALGVDSLNVVRIILAIEDEFNIQINDDDLSIDNLGTINSINNLISNILSQKY